MVGRRARWGRLATALAAGVLLLSGAAALRAPAAQALENGVARTPPMGWNSWNTFGCNINETLIRGMADAIVSSGLRDLGYQYVVVDDCWFNPNRDSSGNLQGDPSRFPSGMKALGDYLHGKGLKFGIYEAPLDKTCGQYFGSYPGATGSGGHETQDARQFAAWGVDYLKYDWCSPTGTINDQVTVFSRMRDALAATGRPIVYSINTNSVHAKTGPQRNWGDVANLWRTTEDIQNMWNGGQTNNYPMGVQNIVDVTVPLAGYAGPGHFNDPDMLEVGRGGGMNDTEMRSHFALWTMLAAPLLAGNDIRSMNAATKAILGNRNLIAIDQDSLGLQATQVSNDGTRRVLAKRLANGDVAVALFNQGGSTTTVSTTAAAIGKAGSSFTLLDAWTGGVSTTSGAISASVPAHGTVVYRVSGTGSSSPAAPSSSPAAPSSSPAGPSSSPPPGGKTCTATYAITGQWQGGFQAAVTVTAGAAPVSSWTVTWQFTGGETVSQAWNATVTASGSAVTAGNVSYNGSLNAGGSTQFGFLGAVNGAPGAPTPRCTAA